MATIPPVPVPLPHQQAANAPRFDPENHLTLEVYETDYETAADAVHLTPTERLAQATCYLGKQEKEDWETFQSSMLCLQIGMHSKKPFFETTRMQGNPTCHWQF